MITALDPKTALVLIDLQKGIVAMPTAHPIKDILEKSAELLAAFRAKGLPVVIVNVNPSKGKIPTARVEKSTMPTDEKTFNESIKMMEEKGFFDITPEIQTNPDDIFITKESWNAFFNTTLDEQLKSIGVTGIVLAGVATSIGVESTAREAIQRGYNLTFANDAMTDTQLAAHESSMNIIFPRIGEVDHTKNIISTLIAL